MSVLEFILFMVVVVSYRIVFKLTQGKNVRINLFFISVLLTIFSNVVVRVYTSYDYATRYSML
jgi:hypothetical protein